MDITSDDKPKHWYVVYTKPRAEKKVATQLNEMGIECYCPVRREVRQWSDRKKKIDVPVLPSMVLVSLPVSKRRRIFECPNTVRYLFWDGKPAIVSQQEVDALKESLQQGKVLSSEVKHLRPGQRISMEEFGFEEEEGEIKYISGNHCWVIMKSMGFVVKLRLESKQA
ncbi:UpxY family transcription antiterminator [Membranihabitans maritimus]|uniref:UpxY family transcription antiterminator n=1 Tax=Membranihabitans maritimus TaxID=2904244 RepID=UPI001F027774|nr:UpxY family transcription antiterminator [Membranihabitans maritimus]